MYNYYNAVPQRYEILHVSGRAGAESLMMAPNSSSLLWDDTAPIVWLVQSDSAGYKTLQALDVAVHNEPKPEDLAQRLATLETKLHELEAKYEPTITDAEQ